MLDPNFLYPVTPTSNLTIGLVIGTYAALPYVHLHLESRRRNYPNVPVLVHDDASPAGRDLRALCGEYGAEFSTNLKRQPIWLGDLSAFAAGFQWGREHGFDVLVKMSRRFIPLYNWVPNLHEMMLHTQYGTFSNRAETANFAFRTECVAMHIGAWDTGGVSARIQERLSEGHTPQVEELLHQLAQDVHRFNCLANRQYELANPKEARFAGYGDWDLLGPDRTTPLCHLLWHHSCRPIEYCRAALQYGITAYSLPEWRQPNHYRPSALWGFQEDAHEVRKQRSEISGGGLRIEPKVASASDEAGNFNKDAAPDGADSKRAGYF